MERGFTSFSKTERYTALSKKKKMVSIIHKELKRKMEKLRQLKFSRGHTQDKLNFQHVN